MDWFPLIVLGLAAVIDLRTREVPDWLSVLLLVGAAFHVRYGSETAWTEHAAGGLVVLGLTFPLFHFGGLGGADVKLTTALGVFVGLSRLWSVLFGIALAGGVLSLVALLRGKRDLAYVPAIALGYLFFLLFEEVFPHGAV